MKRAEWWISQWASPRDPVALGGCRSNIDQVAGGGYIETCSLRTQNSELVYQDSSTKKTGTQRQSRSRIYGIASCTESDQFQSSSSTAHVYEPQELSAWAENHPRTKNIHLSLEQVRRANSMLLFFEGDHVGFLRVSGVPDNPNVRMLIVNWQHLLYLIDSTSICWQEVSYQ